MEELSHGVRLAWSGRAGLPRDSSAELRLERAGDAQTTLILGDNLAALDALSRRGVKVSLAYLDPPFFTGREHHHVERTRGPNGVVRRVTEAFDDRWRSLGHYLGELGARIAKVRELLSPDGCLVLHVDPKTSHYAKVLCDEIFGMRAFASEIIWRYRRWPAKTRNFQRVHDVLLRYTRDPEVVPRFQQLYEPLAASTAKTWGSGRQRAVLDESGRRRRSSVTEAVSPGAPLGDVWDISIVAPVAKERTGYPTQKPQALLSRLIEACTLPGDWVLDPYVGSGTTLAVSAELGRWGIGIDQNPGALKVSERRLQTLGHAPSLERVVSGRSMEPVRRTEGRGPKKTGSNPTSLGRAGAATREKPRSRSAI